MEMVLRERAWAAISSSPAAHFTALEELRKFQASVYGRDSLPVLESTGELAAAHAKANDWNKAEALYLEALEISARRTGGRGFEHVQLLDSTANEIALHDGPETALALEEKALAVASGFPRAEELRETILKHVGELQSQMARQDSAVQ